MMLPLLFAAALSCSHAAPDTFWVLAKKDSKAEPEAIRGALLDESASHYHVRVEGGELWLEKALVQRVEKDDLTVDAIQKLEQDKREKAKAQPAEAGATEAAAEKGEASKPQDAVVGEAAPAVPADTQPEAVPAAQEPKDEGPRYDPVLHRMTGGRSAADARRIEQLREEYRATRSQETRKELRRARRGL